MVRLLKPHGQNPPLGAKLSHMTEKKQSPKSTSWGTVAEWYGDYLEKEDTYQSEVILPNLLRLVGAHKGMRVLDLACGQGFFAHALTQTGAQVVGADIAPELIAQARKNVPHVTFHVTPASKLAFAKDGEFDVAVCVLALQNIEDIAAVFAEVRRVLKQDARFIAVLNHPAFRVLRRSSWGWDAEHGVQYRRVDGYLSGARIAVDMNPGSKSKSMNTISYHRSLQDFFKPLAKAGLAVTRLEEWVSHRASEKGPRQKAEDTARKEIPLFMALEAQCLQRAD